jgi:predicted nucleotidyltransferase
MPLHRQRTQKYLQKFDFESLFIEELGWDTVDRADSDIDVLVSYQPTAKRGLLEKIRMQEELSSLLHRDVDLVSKKAIEQSQNWLRRKNILDSSEVIYVA